MNVLEKFEQDQLESLVADKDIPIFAAGDTIRVNVRIIEGDKERVQGFEGVCIARTNRGLNSAFTVRKVSYGEGVERVFPLYSPRIESIIVLRRGDVRRAKLYYMRELSGKAARIKEKINYSTEQEESAKKAGKKAATAETEEAKKQEQEESKVEVKEEKAKPKKEAKSKKSEEKAEEAPADKPKKEAKKEDQTEEEK